MDSVITVNTDFFLVLAESLLISMSDNTVRMDSISMDFRLYQFPGPNTKDTLNTMD